MKILQIDVNYKNSSTGNIVFLLHKYYSDNGFESIVCYGRGPKVKEKNVFKFGFDLETKMHALLTRITGLMGFFSIFSTARLKKIIKSFNPDVIHVHELHSYFVNYLSLIKFLTKRNYKIVYTLHCEFLYTGKCGHALECANFASTCKKCPHLHDYPKALFFDFTHYMFERKKKLIISNANDAIVVPSEWSLGRVNLSFLKNKKIYLVNNGVDTGIFYPKEDTKKFQIENNILKSRKIIFSIIPDFNVGNKGGNYVLELAKMMPNVIFVCAGINRIKNENIPSNVFQFGIIRDKTKLADFYSMADAFLICSEKETFSMTCAESLCCGTPVVGFDSGAVSQTAPNPYGTFCDFGNLEKLFKIVDETINNNRVDRKAISSYGIKRFSYKVMADKYIEIYKNI